MLCPVVPHCPPKPVHFVLQRFDPFVSLYQPCNTVVLFVNVLLLYLFFTLQLRKLEHSNVVRFVGICADGPDDIKRMIITEYCPKGSLQVGFNILIRVACSWFSRLGPCIFMVNHDPRSVTSVRHLIVARALNAA